MTFQELQKLANEYYKDGGDAILEYWDADVLAKYKQEFGELTRKQVLSLMAMYQEIREEF